MGAVGPLTRSISAIERRATPNKAQNHTCRNSNENHVEKWPWIAAAIAVACLAFLFWPLVVNARRPAQLSFAVKDARAQKLSVEQALNLGAMTRNWVVSEGPCDGDGCNGGVLPEIVPEQLKELGFEFPQYNQQNNSLVWLYQIRPTQVIRHNDIWGDNTVQISGRLTKDKKFYFAAVAREVVAPSHEITVETR